MARPYWSGQIQISLVSFGVKLFPATEAKSEIRFHEINRRSGERVRHQKVSSDDETPVDKNDIVKGYEYSKGEYIQIDPEEVEHLRIASRHTLELEQFVKLDEIDPAMYEKPYFVLPESDKQGEAFGVVRQALLEEKRAGLGKIAMGGREHLVAITAPTDTRLPGLMAYSLRYGEELRSASKYFRDIQPVDIDDDQLALAKELIKRKSTKFDPTRYKDEYEVALRALIDAKLKHLPLPVEKKAPARGKVVNLMDALRRSVHNESDGADRKPQAQTAIKSKTKPNKRGLTLVRSGHKGADKRRKSA